MRQVQGQRAKARSPGDLLPLDRKSGHQEKSESDQI
jgi:hypothetical protein